MATINQVITSVKIEDNHFIGTIAFKSENKTLPDGSKIALGIDGIRWVLIYQKPESNEIISYEYNSEERMLLVDKQLGAKEDVETMNRLVSYFFQNADEEDLVTILPPRIVK